MDETNAEREERYLKILNQIPFSELTALFSEIPSNTEETKLISLEYLDCVYNDIKAFKLCYNAELFSLSTFFLQQATEKVIKAYCYGYMLKKEQLKTHIAYRDILRFMKKHINISNAMSEQQVQKEQITSLLSEEGEEGLKKLPKQDFISLISILNNIEKVKNEKKKELAGSIKRDIYPLFQRQEFLEFLKKHNLDKSIEEIKKGLSSISEKDLETVIVRQINTLPLFLLGIVTAYHDQSTRYPFNERLPEYTPKAYTKNLFIVKYSEELMHFIEIYYNELLDIIKS